VAERAALREHPRAEVARQRIAAGRRARGRRGRDRGLDRRGRRGVARRCVRATGAVRLRAATTARDEREHRGECDQCGARREERGSRRGRAHGRHASTGLEPRQRARGLASSTIEKAAGGRVASTPTASSRENRERPG